MNLFASDPSDAPYHYPIPLADAELVYYPQLFRPDEATALKQALLTAIDWRQEQIMLFGKPVDQPRLTAWHGDPGTMYTYSGLTLTPRPWTPELDRIRARVEAATGRRFNSVLLNLYRTGEDSMGWHSDDEPELGRNPLIASVSLGEERPLHFRHRFRPGLTKRIPLQDGSLLVMAGTTQHFWLHQIAKTTRPVEARLNLTFRILHPPG